MKVYVIKNVQHNMLEKQTEIINTQFDNPEIEYLDIPAEGLDLEGCRKFYYYIYRITVDKKNPVIFVSPVIQIIAGLLNLNVYNVETGNFDKIHYWIFLNDQRNKVEKDGKVFYAVSPDGWYLQRITEI